MRLKLACLTDPIVRLTTRTRQFIRSSLGRYLVIGSSVYFFELGIIFVAQLAGASSLLAVGLSFWLGLIISFILQKFVTFNDRRTHHRVLISQIIAVCVLVLFNFGFTLLVTSLLTPILPPYVTRTIALAITTLWNFYLYRTRIFKSDDSIID